MKFEQVILKAITASDPDKEKFFTKYFVNNVKFQEGHEGEPCPIGDILKDN